MSRNPQTGILVRLSTHPDLAAHFTTFSATVFCILDGADAEGGSIPTQLRISRAGEVTLKGEAVGRAAQGRTRLGWKWRRNAEKDVEIQLLLQVGGPAW